MAWVERLRCIHKEWHTAAASLPFFPFTYIPVIVRGALLKEEEQPPMLRVLSAVLTGCLEQLRESRLTFVLAREWTIPLLLLLLVVHGSLILLGGASRLIVVLDAPVSVFAARVAAGRLFSRMLAITAMAGIGAVRVAGSAVSGGSHLNDDAMLGLGAVDDDVVVRGAKHNCLDLGQACHVSRDLIKHCAVKLRSSEMNGAGIGSLELELGHCELKVMQALLLKLVHIQDVKLRQRRL